MPVKNGSADQCVPLEFVLALRGHGHEVLLLRDHLPIRSLDPVVIAMVRYVEGRNTEDIDLLMRCRR